MSEGRAHISLRLLTPEQYQAWLTPALLDYADAKVRSGNWTSQEAEARAQTEFTQLLPAGRHTPDHYFYGIYADETYCGVIWLAKHMGRTDPGGWIYDLIIFEPFRRRGYAQGALRLLEHEARDLGFKLIELHVFGDNVGAQALYAKAGYEVTNIIMSRELDPE